MGAPSGKHVSSYINLLQDPLPGVTPHRVSPSRGPSLTMGHSRQLPQQDNTPMPGTKRHAYRKTAHYRPKAQNSRAAPRTRPLLLPKVIRRRRRGAGGRADESTRHGRGVSRSSPPRPPDTCGRAYRAPAPAA